MEVLPEVIRRGRYRIGVGAYLVGSNIRKQTILNRARGECHLSRGKGSSKEGIKPQRAKTSVPPRTDHREMEGHPPRKLSGVVTRGGQEFPVHLVARFLLGNHTLFVCRYHTESPFVGKPHFPVVSDAEMASNKSLKL
jgi:hypothetical protein